MSLLEIYSLFNSNFRLARIKMDMGKSFILHTPKVSLNQHVVPQQRLESNMQNYNFQSHLTMAA